MEKHLLSLNIAFEAISNNKMRALLTALGIIFGVASVIAMLSIGAGAKEEILEQMKLIGVNNIIIKTKEFDDKSANKNEAKKNKYSPGLNIEDMLSIANVLPEVEAISPEIMIEKSVMSKNKKVDSRLIGVDNPYFDINNFEIETGKFFNKHQLQSGAAVCIIGFELKKKIFPSESPIGKSLKCGNIWLTVVGVLKSRNVSEEAQENLGMRDYNIDLFVPYKTVLLRYRNRSLITNAKIEAANNTEEDEEGNSLNKNVQEGSIHQLDKIIVKIKETEKLSLSADIISRLLKRKHYGVIDFEIFIPELLLKQQQKTKDIFNWVLFAIAFISLLVGGIGIMNIMLASVYERIKEIGLRIALGAKQNDVILQFLYEAVLISVSGGIIGIILGVSFSYIASIFADIKTIITFSSIFVSFGVAVLTGLVFGIFPARKAALQDPITSLRHE